MEGNRLAAALPVVLLVLLAGVSASCHQESVPPTISPGRTTGAEVLGDGEQLATFAGGCFWCMEPPFEGLRGVRSVVSGYTGGREDDPTYELVSRGLTGHAEAVQVRFHPDVISYKTLVEIYWRSMDPTDAGGQFADRGSQYRPGIFYHDDAQRAVALASMRALGNSGRFKQPIVVEVTKFEAFYPAEPYHQDFYRTHPDEYKAYRRGSGRAGFLERVWGADLQRFERRLERYRKPSQEQLRAKLTWLQYRVTQLGDTETAFANPLWNNKRRGIYVDVASGEPLFSSRDKYDSGTGWPSFVKPLIPGNLVEVKDTSHGMVRIEVRSKHGDSHLGHLFIDGPGDRGGLRYCINSAALRFVPAEQLEKQGYGPFSTALDVARGNEGAPAPAGK